MIFTPTALSSTLKYKLEGIGLAASIFIITTLLSACGPRTTNVETGDQLQILHMGNAAEPQDLDPHTSTGVPETHIITALMEPLVAANPKTLAPEPGIAKSWDISSDGKTYVFHLRESYWSNGDALTAHDYVYSWRRLLEPNLASEYAYQLHSLHNAKAYNLGQLKDFSQVGVKALDALTLEVTLNNATPYFLSLLDHHSTYVVHQGTIETFGNIDTRSTQWTREANYVGNGPFILKEWALNRIIRVERNPYYWDASTVKLNEIRFYPIDDLTTEERMFRAGTLHITDKVPAHKIAQYEQQGSSALNISPWLGTYFYRLNVNKPPLDDIRVRQALSLSIDREAIVNFVTKGGQLPSYTFTPPNTAGYTASPQYQYSIVEAQKLLADAGFPNGKGFPDIDLLFNTDEDHRAIAEAIQQMWKKALGINIALYNQDWKVYLDVVNHQDYTIARASWIGDYSDPNTFLDMFLTGGGNNRTGWSNAEYDALIAKAATLQDQQERYATLNEAETILLQEGPIIPIYTYTRVYLRTDSLKGWHPNILDRHPYKYVYLDNSPASSQIPAEH